MAAEVELVGRGAELARIAEALDAGEPGVLLAGPASSRAAPSAS